MEIIRKVPVKQLLTPSSREQLKTKFNDRWTQLDRECRQLSFEQKKLEKRASFSKQEVEKRFSKAMNQRKDQMNWIEQQLQQLDILPDGSELEIDQVEAVVSVHEGDSWAPDQEIIIKDGKVIRAR